MSSTQVVRQLLASVVMVAAGIGCVTPASADAERAARALAEKFSSAADEADRRAAREFEEAERRKREEAEMLARARAELEAREAAAVAAEEAAAAKRAAEDARHAAEAVRRQDEARRLEDRERRERPAAERAQAKPPTPPRASVPAAEPAESLEVQRTREAEALSEKLRRVREQRSTLGGEPALARTGKARRSVAEPLAPAEPAGQRVTVLLRMDPGAKGIRRWNKSADAVLCVAESCYVSRGPAAPAEKMPRWQAFGPLTTLFTRAGACSNALACIFRDVDLEAARALVEPVDLRFIVHDRREAREAEADPSCRLAHIGRLTCERTLVGSGWSAWIVPEGVAVRAGSEALADALAANLSTRPGDLARR
jgi:hypothetical protein